MVTPEFVRVLKSDLPYFHKLAKEIWLPTFRPYFTEEELYALFHEMYQLPELEKLVARPDYRLYFILPEAGCTLSETYGYLGCQFFPTHLKLDKIYLRAENQGKGLGRIAIRFVEKLARRKQMDRIILRVNVRNLPAISFYKSQGFEITSSETFTVTGGYIYEDHQMTKNRF